MNADGSGVTELGIDMFSFDWSPDGKKFAGLEGPISCRPVDEWPIVVRNIDGSGGTRIVTLPRQPDGGPKWSPDGSKIVFAADLTIYVVNADGSGQVNLGSGRTPAWSPDSKRIVYAAASPSTLPRPARLFVMNADGSGKVQLLINDDTLDTAGGPDWGSSPLLKDLAPPAVTLSVSSSQKLKSALRKGIDVALTCTEACKLKLKLFLARKSARRLGLSAAKGGIVVGSASGSGQAGTTKTIKVKFNAKAKRRLRRAGKVKLTLQVKATDGSKNTKTLSRRIKLQR
jgi:hypothetical protein